METPDYRVLSFYFRLLHSDEPRCARFVQGEDEYILQEIMINAILRQRIYVVYLSGHVNSKKLLQLIIEYGKKIKYITDFKLSTIRASRTTR